MYVFEKLELISRAAGFSAIIENLAEDFPPSIDYFSDRLVDSARAIPAHVAEAHGHWKEEERREFFWKAREAIQECAGLIEVAVRQGLMDEKTRLKIRSRLDTLQKMIQDSLRLTERKVEAIPTGAGPFDLKVL